eukprot:4328140-Lingulodinium_polyedra.AAC.1
MAAEVPPRCAELVRILGFRPGCACPGITSVVAQVLRNSAEFGWPCFIGVGGVRAAFDELQHW